MDNELKVIVTLIVVGVLGALCGDVWSNYLEHIEAIRCAERCPWGWAYTEDQCTCQSAPAVGD